MVTVAQPLQKTIQTLKNQNKYKNNLVYCFLSEVYFWNRVGFSKNGEA